MLPVYPSDYYNVMILFHRVLTLHRKGILNSKISKSSVSNYKVRINELYLTNPFYVLNYGGMVDTQEPELSLCICQCRNSIHELKTIDKLSIPDRPSSQNHPLVETCKILHVYVRHIRMIVYEPRNRITYSSYSVLVKINQQSDQKIQ